MSFDDPRGVLLDQGWYVVRGLLPESTCLRALDRLRRIAADLTQYRELPNIHPVSVPALAMHADPLLRYDWIDQITCRDAVLWDLVAAHPALLAQARAVLGSEVFWLNGGGCFMKPPGSPRGVPWHQDASPVVLAPLAGRTQAPPLFDFWLGLTAAHQEMGPLQLIPGSQHRGRLPHHTTPGNLFAHLDPAVHGYGPGDIVTIETGPGDLIVWHQDVIHGSAPNRSQQPRVGVASIYHGRNLEDELRREHRRGAIRTRHRFCEGMEIFPCPDPIPLPATAVLVQE